MRRSPVLLILLLLLASLLPLPAAPPTLVCRMTGQVVAAVTAPESRSGRSCCRITRIARADGQIDYALRRPGCCELRGGDSHSQPPIMLAAPQGAGDAYLPAFTPLADPIFVLAAGSELSVPPSVAPTVPPPGSCSPRGPPLFS